MVLKGKDMGIDFSASGRGDSQDLLGVAVRSPYDVYDLEPDELAEGAAYFLDPDLNCYGVFNERDELVAYCTFGPDGQVPGGEYAEGALDIGLGVRPDLTGEGKGLSFVDAVVGFAPRNFGHEMLRVTVAAFNERAQRVWAKAGFQIAQRFEREPDGMEFVVMVRWDRAQR
jgi:ribosomal-protein-alanine N-acetyltransferase